jgi:signal transduction histidine kinase
MTSPPRENPPKHKGERAVSRRSHLLPLLGGGFFVIAVIVALIGWAVLQGKADAHRIAVVTTANLAKILADNMNSIIRQSDLGIQSILDEVSEQQRAPQFDEKAILDTISLQDARQPDLLGLRVIGADGKLRYALNNILNKNSDFSQREEFKYMRDTPGSGLVVSPPLFGHATGEWLIGVARRITNPDGSFGGAVYGPIPIRTLMKAYAAIDIGNRGTITLFHTNFQTAARFPETTGPKNPIGTIAMSPGLHTVVESGVRTAQYEYTSPVDSVRRTGSILRIEGQPYYIVVGVAEDDYLVEWRRDSSRFMLFGGFMVGVVLLCMAILHRRILDWQRATAALGEKTALLTQSNTDLEQFAYVASHDLQTPLRTMVRYSQLLERRYAGRLDHEADDFIAFIVDSGKRMTLLITDLLQYSRIGSQTKPLQAVSADEALRQALFNMALDVKKSGAQITHSDLPQVMGEASQLVSLFQNLLENGLRYHAPDRKPQLSVTAERVSPDHWQFAVSDNGIGIAPQYFDKIFDIFQRLDPSIDTGGTGIGLTLCRRIVHRFGGTIWVDSTPGIGTTFCFTLRAAAA